MESEKTLSDCRKRFFLDDSLIKFWTQIDIANLSMSDAENLTGCIFAPLDTFDTLGTRERRNNKINIKDAQNRASKLMDEAETLAFELREKLDEIASLTPYYPDELQLCSLVENLKLDDALKINGLSSSSPYFKITFSDLLLQLEIALKYYPREMRDISPHIPALHSNKSSKLDYLRQVISNLNTQHLLEKINLRETNWVDFYKVMVDKGNGARDAVKKVLNEYKK